ncbi:transposase [Pseudoalteromonas marina]|jgi:putative transposase|uniref:Transposase n=1 Tax=Pseudoalteromonas marina TaxID=267375 RepID=A0ABT9FF64_9GAMM|nr:transposase [Pseudoalteromonas marina]MDA8938988.1 transposase [Pseudoalteromonas marina]MDP2565432.1 transposase [Pseudoalteromonas marina]
MSRPLRIEYENAFYHVMNRGRGRDNTFLSDDDFKYFLYSIEQASLRFNIEVHSYCLMTNHYHLLIKTPDANLGRAMKHINGLYTQYFNRAHNTDGALFRGRYKAVLVDADNYLLHVSRYIHRNPIETSTPMVDDLAKYKWSSYSSFIKRGATPKWLVRDFIFSLQGKKRQYAAYKQFVEYENNEEISAFYSSKKLLSVLGCDNFIENIKDYIAKSNSERKLVSKKHSADDVISYIAKHFSVEVDDIVMAKKGRKEKNLPRWFAIKLCQDLTGLNLQALADIFNVKHYSAISKTVCRLNALMIENKKVKLQLEELRGCLMSEVKI